MRTPNRRHFLQDTAALAARLAAIPAMAARGDDNPREDGAKPVGPNDALRVAVCGVHGRGMDHVRGWSSQKDVRITAICDVDLNTTEHAKRAVAKKYGSEPKIVQDVR